MYGYQRNTIEILEIQKLRLESAIKYTTNEQDRTEIQDRIEKVREQINSSLMEAIDNLEDIMLIEDVIVKKKHA